VTTPIRSALVASSALIALVQDGLQSMERSHARDLIEPGVRPLFADSLDLDAALRRGHEGENRWDYLLGHEASWKILALEPHTASNREVSTVIKKRESAVVQLRGHMKPGTSVFAWLWVASGKVDFVPIDKAYLRLAQSGITFVGRRLLKKHLPGAVMTKRPAKGKSKKASP
jgi:hypothetical protein